MSMASTPSVFPKEIKSRIGSNRRIPSAVYYPKCLHQQPAFSSWVTKGGIFQNFEKAARKVLSLPMHPFLIGSDQYTVVANSLSP